MADVYRCYERTLHTQIMSKQTGAGQRSACSHHTSFPVCFGLGVYRVCAQFTLGLRTFLSFRIHGKAIQNVTEIK